MMSPKVTFENGKQAYPHKYIDDQSAENLLDKIYPGVGSARLFDIFHVTDTAAFEGRGWFHDTAFQTDGHIVDKDGPAYKLDVWFEKDQITVRSVRAEGEHRKYAKTLFNNIVAFAQEANVPMVRVDHASEDGSWFWLAKCGVQPDIESEKNLRQDLLTRLETAKDQIKEPTYRELTNAITTAPQANDSWKNLALRSDIKITTESNKPDSIGHFLFVNQNYSGEYKVPPAPQITWSLKQAPCDAIEPSSAEIYFKEIFPGLEPKRLFDTFNITNDSYFNGDALITPNRGIHTSGRIVDNQGEAYRFSMSFNKNVVNLQVLNAFAPRRRLAKKLFSNIVSFAQEANIDEIAVTSICSEGSWFWPTKCDVQPERSNHTLLKEHLLDRLNRAEEQITKNNGRDAFEELAATIKALGSTPDGWKELALRKDIAITPAENLHLPRGNAEEPIGRYLFLRQGYAGTYKIPALKS